MATELLSHTIATALYRYKPNTKVSSATAEFIDACNAWFDLMNSYVPKSCLITTKWGYGLAKAEQDAILTKFYNLTAGMRVKGKRTLEVFQQGILMSSNAVRALLHDVSCYGVKYLLTHRLNQDVLENYFSQLRSTGGLDDHPTPLSALKRLRLIILGHCSSSVLGHTNTKDESTGNELFVYSGWEFEPSVMPAELPECSKDALVYLAGWIAKMFRSRYPDLGHQRTKHSDHAYQLPSWVQQLSFVAS